ncbi:uncharacterized protein LOC110269414 [Arachis ipaensis]|uniref:uncharacterized protein LOC110269414 n=1 Tax=Arachis ipaensis TaxID=130454 RepID=UPI000A2B07EB|nr:uncharacterized protein LOC110269414 [Arachis ipaensis]
MDPEIINNPLPSSSIPQASSTPTTTIAKPLSIPLPEKLNNDNFLTWCHSAILTISSQELEDHLDKAKIPVRYASPADAQAQKESKAYREWRLDDYNVASWLFSSMDPSFKHRVGSASDYLLEIKKVVDSLATVGAPLTGAEYTNVILDGLNEDYQSFLTYVTAKDPPYSIPDLEALLMAQEDIVERFKKPDSSMVQVNFTQSQPVNQNNSDPNFGRHTTNMPSRGTYGRRGRGGRSQRGGRGAWNNPNRPQCQICGKLGHVASYCYFRFDQQFQHAQQNSGLSSMHNALPPPPSFHNHRALLATPITMVDPSWYADSGASHHCTPDQSNLEQSQEYHGQYQMYIGNGSGY